MSVQIRLTLVAHRILPSMEPFIWSILRMVAGRGMQSKHNVQLLVILCRHAQNLTFHQLSTFLAPAPPGDVLLYHSLVSRYVGRKISTFVYITSMCIILIIICLNVISISHDIYYKINLHLCVCVSVLYSHYRYCKHCQNKVRDLHEIYDIRLVLNKQK